MIKINILLRKKIHRRYQRMYLFYIYTRGICIWVKEKDEKFFQNNIGARFVIVLRNKREAYFAFSALAFCKRLFFIYNLC